MNMRVHLGKIDFGTRQRKTEWRDALGLGRMLGSGEQRLGRDAAVVQAVAAHLAFFDQHHRYAERRRRGRNRKAAGAGADDTDVRGQELRNGHRLPLWSNQVSGAGRARPPWARTRFTITGMSDITPSAASAASSCGVTIMPRSKWT